MRCHGEVPSVDTKKLDVLLKVARIGSLKKTAEELNYTQSGLIYMMNTLEEEIGVELLSRTPKGVFLSEAGQRLEPFIRDVVQSEQALMDAVEEISQGRAHKLRIGVYPIFARYYLSDVIKKYMDDHPEDGISIHVGTEEDIPLWLENDQVDLAIGESNLVGKGKWIHLVDDAVYAAIPSSFNIEVNEKFKLTDIGDYPVLYSDYNPVSRRVDELIQSDANRIEVTSKDGSALLSMVESQLGIAFLSGLYRYDCPLGVEMYPVDPPVARKLGIILRPDRDQQGPMLRRFIPYLQDIDFTADSADV